MKYQHASPHTYKARDICAVVKLLKPMVDQVL
jgi:hypothetical protein